MSNNLSGEQIAAFDADGFVSPLHAFPAAEACEYRARLEALEATSTNARSSPHVTTRWGWDLVHDPRIVEPVADLLGPDVLLWSFDWFIKEPGTTYVSWHQDATYWGLSPHHVVSAWVALSDAGPATGPMIFIPGSHHGEILEQKDTFAEDNMLSRGQAITNEIDSAKGVMAPLATGEMSLHHVRIVHGSEPNTTDDRRIGMVLRYCSTDVKQVKVDGDRAVLVKGEDRFRNFEMIERPIVDNGQQETALLKAHGLTRQRALHSADYE